jgi:NAD(P)-dependent dehydrogenase (short-subunit alcohol dehydrogenase family)
MDLQLNGKRAVITGGSSGIGKAIARAFAEEGVDVVIAARTEETLEAAAAELSAETGGNVIGVVADTTDDASVKAMVEGAVEALGGVDILVNSAAVPGGSGPSKTIGEIDTASLLEDVDVKIGGYVRTAQAVAPHMVEGGWGRIFNIGGMAARYTGSYSAGMRCAAISALTENLAEELGTKGVNSITIHPGITRTEKITGPKYEEAAVKKNTIGRMIDASELAWLVTVLASPRSVTLNGATIPAGGGLPLAIHY